MHIHQKSLAFLCATMLASQPFAAAQAGDFLFQWDNDKVADTDRHYTNGMRLGYVPTKPAFQLTYVATKLATICLFNTPDNIRAGWVIGQDMYTPEDVYATVPDPLDRPYAGWTYLGVTAQSETTKGLTDFNQQDTIEVDFGIVGPASRAGETQNWFHRKINVSQSRGWDHQIGSELGLLVTRTLKLRMPLWEPFGKESPAFDIIPHATAQVGNIKIAAAAGATLRFGGNLGEDFGPIYGTFAMPRARPDHLTWSFFIGAEARAVARDMFLGGNTFKDSPSVKHNPFVLESRIGITTHMALPKNWWANGVRLDLSHVQRTREFTTQDKSDRYGSFKLTVNY
ncbi:MAG: lipid A deacylase LpxR family protein [Magnetovibrio sp.]|nr:lipid A deacylase LpxR family protein [Magnetovibrio sp.]